VPLIQRFASRNILRTAASIIIKPMYEVRIPVSISHDYSLCPSLIEPLLKFRSKPYPVAKIFVDPESYITVCQIVNITERPISIAARTAIATITPAEIQPQNKKGKIQRKPNVSAVNVLERDLSLKEKIIELQTLGFKVNPKDYSEVQFKELVDLLFEYRSAFAQEVTDLPGVTDLEFKINLKPGTIPKRQRQYKYPPHLRAEIRKQLDQWESAGIIECGEANWIHPIVLVKKKSLSGNPNELPKY